MAQRIPVQTRLPRDIVLLVRAHCALVKISVSEWIRLLVIHACRDGEISGIEDQASERLARDLTFTTVALDALLAGHPDPELRHRTHQAYARKLARRGVNPVSIEGGGDEA